MADLLTQRQRLFARRFTAGLTPALATEIRNAGTPRAWFVRQLDHTAVSDAPGAAVDAWFPSLQRTPRQIFQRQVDEIQGSWEVMYDLSRWTVTRRLRSKRQVYEQMVDFWSNLLHVPLGHDEAAFHRVSYDQVIRRHALGSFDDLLVEAITHPAMGLFLDNATSSKDAPNENLGREVLELHSVGVEAGYTEEDVLQSSRLLTGYRVDLWWPDFRAFYDQSWHYTGRIDVLGFSHANTSTDGRAATEAYLRYLARHPATARRIAGRLAQRFVSDTPSEALVNKLANVYLRNGSAIKPVLMALVDHPDFLASYGKKIRTPMEDWLATARALRIGVKAPTSDDSFVNAMVWQYKTMGAAPYEWSAPDGYPETGAAWTSAGRVLGSLDLHRTLAAGWWPTEQATYRPMTAWLPALPATVAQVIDHLGRELLGQTVSAAVRQAVATSVGLPLDRRVTRDDLWDYRVMTMLASLLDSPIHFYR